jgi:hypothetical protein
VTFQIGSVFKFYSRIHTVESRLEDAALRSAVRQRLLGRIGTACGKRHQVVMLAFLMRLIRGKQRSTSAWQNYSTKAANSDI